ncbi:LOW QUALITY PROTEIN: acid sphingomyelinase-like phosphodiesterase 3b [Haliotis rubra]|uniref:LOW QUALITY PROTEIN: acid sphingomyelinase-like phosphodiesterase 3b n=1 Tax=Haliotis rubra TaxID=36100 RepID=UPI001EE54222|nr:LOW QUALITY PROTEIN: acid sphingomyelinase-like phosphodiesterase 3b [Haliotis rubra]
MLRLLCVILWITSGFALGGDIGKFWQLSDVHFDPDYSQNGNPKKQCHFSNDSTGNPGYYGNYLCDSPFNLVESVIENMRNMEAEPDFILWTGESDTGAQSRQIQGHMQTRSETQGHIQTQGIRHGHIKTQSQMKGHNPDRYRDTFWKSVDDVFGLIRNISTVLKEAFPNTTLLPLLGNHDAFPSNQMPLVESGTHYYDDILTKGDWSELLEKHEQDQFQKGGYYSRSVQKGLRLVMLNSNLWYSMNKQVTGNLDPNQQLAWLRQQLTEAKAAQQKVYIVAHICPGAFERLQSMTWFYPEFNRHYLDLITEHSETIAAHFCGHEHTDSFRLVEDAQGTTSSLMYLSPALTPWKSPLPRRANNPSVRLYHYSRSTSTIMDYQQYYLNLTQANKDHLSPGKWQLEYQATQAYNITDCSPRSFDNLANTFQASNVLFKHYMDYNTVSYNNSAVCGQTCYTSQICAILYLDLYKYNNCLFWSGTTPQPHHHTTSNPHHTTTHHKRRHPPPLPQYVYYIIGGMGTLIVALAVTVSCLCVRKRRQGIPFKYSHFVGPINS